MYGVEYRTFWLLNPKKLKIFEKDFEKKQELAQARMNLEAWVHGIYVQNAIASVLGKNYKYPSKPHELFGTKPKTVEDEGLAFERYVAQYRADRMNQSINRS